MTTKISGDTGIEFPDATQQITRGVPNDAPLVRVYSNTPQAYTASVIRKVQFENIDFDLGSGWSVENSRYNPSVAGWYSVIAAVRFDGSSGNNSIVRLYKNGTPITHGTQLNETNLVESLVHDLVFLDGDQDYLEVWAAITVTKTITGDRAGTFLAAHLVRAL